MIGSRILVAEDDAHTRAAMAELLEAEGYSVFAVDNGMSAIESLRSQRFDLICLDVMMPMRSGFDVCRFLREQNIETPVIFITAKAEEIDKIVGFEVGADDYICKPFGVHEVQARIRAVLRRCRRQTDPDRMDDPMAGEPFQMKDLTVHPSRLTAHREEIQVDLSKREVHILKLLYEADGDVVSRQELFRRCWGSTANVQTRTVDQTVSQLRKRVERNPKRPEIIETVYAVGYRYRGSTPAAASD